MYPWIIHGSFAIQCSSYPSNSEIQCIHGLSMDHSPSNVVATPVIRNNTMYPWIIHGLSMDHPPSNVVATPVIRKYNVSMDYPWIIHGSSAIQCSSYPSNSEIQCIHGLSMDHPPSNVVATPVIRKCNISMDYPWIICRPM